MDETYLVVVHEPIPNPHPRNQKQINLPQHPPLLLRINLLRMLRYYRRRKILRRRIYTTRLRQGIRTLLRVHDFARVLQSSTPSDVGSEDIFEVCKSSKLSPLDECRFDIRQIRCERTIPFFYWPNSKQKERNCSRFVREKREKRKETSRPTCASKKLERDRQVHASDVKFNEKSGMSCLTGPSRTPTHNFKPRTMCNRHYFE